MKKITLNGKQPAGTGFFALRFHSHLKSSICQKTFVDFDPSCELDVVLTKCPRLQWRCLLWISYCLSLFGLPLVLVIVQEFPVYETRLLIMIISYPSRWFFLVFFSECGFYGCRVFV